jgi:hypothetical protein
MKLRFLRSAPAAFAGDQLETASDGTDDDRLKHATLGD